MKKRYIVLFVTLLIRISPVAQDSTSNPVFLGLKPYYGFIIPHSEAIAHVSNSNPYGIEVDYGWILSRQSDWERCNCYSRAGFSTSYINFDNPGILGSAVNLTMFVEPYLNYRSNGGMSLRMGVGPSYVTKIYEEKTNPENLFFGIHLNFIIYLDIMFNFRLSDHLNGKIFGRYSHISNGSVAHPNKGMNFPKIGVGMDYVFKPRDFPERKPVPVKQKEIVASAAVFGTIRKKVAVKAGDSRKSNLGYGFLVKGRKKITKINALNTGIEGFQDSKLKRKAEGEKDHRQLSLLAGHDFVFGRFIFSQYWGTYLYAPYYKRDFFQRYSLTFNLTGDWRVGVNLKAHAQVAENFNLHLAYDLN